MDKKKKIIILVVILLILFIGLGTVIAIVANNDTEAERTTTTSTVEQSTPVDAEVTTTVPSSESEATEEPTSTTESNEATEEPMTTEEPEAPTPESTEPQASVHTHSYSSKITQPTCTSQGYTTYTCNCGHSYKDNYINGSHNYTNGTCTACGAADPNWVPPHTHSWTEHTWTEDVVNGQTVQVYVCDCNIEWSSMADLNAHQANEPLCTGWSNKGKWIETITQIIHHYRECACGAREDID